MKLWTKFSARARTRPMASSTSEFRCPYAVGVIDLAGTPRDCLDPIIIRSICLVDGSLSHMFTASVCPKTCVKAFRSRLNQTDSWSEVVHNQHNLWCCLPSLMSTRCQLLNALGLGLPWNLHYKHPHDTPLCVRKVCKVMLGLFQLLRWISNGNGMGQLLTP